MRAPARHVAKDGTVTYKVRFRQGGVETSQTFRRKTDADEFSAILSGGGVVAALSWLKARDDAASELTFGQWFAHYLDQLTGITDRTRRSYKSLYDNHLAHLGPLPLPLLTRTHVTTLVNDLDRAGKSPKTIKNIIHMLSSCLALAIDEQHLTRNPCRRVTLPKAALTDNDPRFLTEAEFGRLVAAAPEHYRDLLIFLVGTGLRWSEATALQCRHVNVATGTILVRQAWKEQGGRELGPPKTKKGRRTVNPATAALAAAHANLRAPDDWLFTTPTGKIVRHSNFYNRVWTHTCVRAGLGQFTRDTDGKDHYSGPVIHDLRHTHASWLISDGIQLEAVQDQLGHESILTTRKIYGELLPALGVAVGKSASAGLARALNSVQTGVALASVGSLNASGGADERHDPSLVAPVVIDGRDG